VLDLIKSTGASLDTGDDVSPWIDTDKRIFFPLPANDQQRQIVRDLEHRRGLVVQGPPGTGKSQTIANLICHSLSTGKRVLVTSHAPRALQVLQDKLPAEFGHLCVSILGQGRAGSEDVKRSANTLLSRMNDPQYRSETLEKQIKRIQTRLEELHDEGLEIRENLSKLNAEKSASTKIAPGYEGQMASLVERLADEEASLGWITDDLTTEAPPMDDNQLAWLVKWHESAHDDPGILLSWRLPPLEEVIEPADFARLIAHRSELDSIVKAGRDLDLSRRLNVKNGQSRERLVELSQAVIDQEGVVSIRPDGWLGDARYDIETGKDEIWRGLAKRTDAFLDSTGDLGIFGDLLDIPYTPGRIANLVQQAKALVEYFDNGGSIHRVLKARPQREAAELLTLDVDGRAITDLETCREILRRLEISDALLRCERHWGDNLTSVSPTLAARVARLRDERESLGLLLQLHECRVALGTALELPDPEVLPGTAKAINTELRGQTAEEDILTAEQRLKDCCTPFRRTNALDDVHPSVQTCLRALARRDSTAYELATVSLEQAIPHAKEIGQAEELMARLQAAAPELAASVRKASTDTNETYLERAWSWRLAVQAVLKYDAGLDPIFRSLSENNTETAKQTTLQGERSAWRHAVRNLSDVEQSHLKAYQKALGRLGKGGGKRANEHRQSARNHLEKCQQAIPVWIMPTYRVAETIMAHPQTFDLVIIDEASQSGPEALFLLWLGKQIIVVGDDNQISPAHVGIPDDAVARLQQKYLSDFELRDLLDVKNSLFDQAMVRYSGEIWLTEHFRCMPEIIEFSNREIYAPQHHRLEPLRQFGVGRLAPLRSTWVPEAAEEGGSGKKVNRIEAEILVRQVVKCHEDPAYDGKTFGIISLLGMPQAQVIQQMLFARLGPEAWQDRSLRCGDASAFQGDERDVVFLSMVKTLDSDRERIPKLGNVGTRQQYNVAASRARDQMWLFHSMALDELNPDCFRAKLLRHCSDPSPLDINGFTETVYRDVRHPDFDSLFEQRVFLDLRERGFVIEPQVEVYQKSIDLVVAGQGGKLAIECDGAAFHGPDNYAADVERQQVLERIGWQFHRITDTDYYFDHEATMDAAVDRLAAAGIYPAGMGRQGESISEPQQTADVVLQTPDVVLQTPDVVLQTPFESSSSDVLESRETLEPDADGPMSKSASDDETKSISPARWDDVGFSPSEKEQAACEPYVSWNPYEIGPLDDMASYEIRKLLNDVVEIEGPILVNRLFQVIFDATGNTLFTQRIREKLLQELSSAVRQEDLIIMEPEDRDQMRSVVCTPMQPKLSLRSPGPRGIHQYPDDELAAFITHLRDGEDLAEDDEFADLAAEFDMDELSSAAVDLVRRSWEKYQRR